MSFCVLSAVVCFSKFNICTVFRHLISLQQLLHEMFSQSCTGTVAQLNSQNFDGMVDVLHTKDIPEDETVLPSPEDLSGYVLVKVI